MTVKELRDALVNAPDDFEVRLQVDQYIRGSLDYGSRCATANVVGVKVGDVQYPKVWLRGTEER